LSGLSSSKATGLDKISGKILKAAATIIKVFVLNYAEFFFFSAKS
jgi:hypothetical protein